MNQRISILFPCFVFCLGLLCQPLFSQETQEYHAWNALFTTHSLTASNSLRLETHYRTQNFYATQQQILIRPSFIRKLSKHASVAVGYTYLDTGLGEQRVKENNLWEQLFVKFPIHSRINFFGWIRAEHRWIGRQNPKFVSRIRFRNGIDIPLKKDDLSVLVYNEAFLNFDHSFPAQFNQNWTYFGFSKKLRNNLRLQSGFQRASLPKNAGILARNIWFTILFWQL